MTPWFSLVVAATSRAVGASSTPVTVISTATCKLFLPLETTTTSASVPKKFALGV
jgi:hypothetical protein